MPITVEIKTLMNLIVTNKLRGKKKRKYVIKKFNSGYEHSYQLNRPVFKIKEIDRRHDRYYEKVIDEETGETIHECNEPLSKHIEHGSAKVKK